MVRWVLAVSPDKCVGCRTCEIACSMAKTGECNPEKSRIRVINLEKEGFSMPIVCRHCGKPPCMDACAVVGVNAISKDMETGVVSISEDKCIGCGFCVGHCPFGAISIDPENQRLIKCDLCGELRDVQNFAPRKPFGI